MRLLVKDIKLQYNEQGRVEVVLTTDSRILDISKEKEVISKGKQLIADIKQYRRPRSLDANAYMWQLCQKIAEAIRATKEEVYQKAVREVGQFEIISIRENAVERWIEAWNSKGLGWHAEVMGDSKFPGFKNVINYFGSSVYDTKQMSILIDYIVEECKELGIETLPPAELQRLKEEWRHDVPKATEEKEETANQEPETDF